MNNFWLSMLLLGAGSIGYTLPASALSPVEVQRIARQSTVRIKGCDNGSGVIIQKNGTNYTILTAAHATRTSGCQIVTADDMEYGVTQVTPFANSVDLAMIEFNSHKTYRVAKSIDNSDRVEGGENVYVSGFPMTTAIVDPIFTFVQGKLIGNGNKLQTKGYSMVYDNPTLPGHSGGPVWNDKGEMIAIHGQGDIDTKIKETNSPNVRIKTGFNLGITVNTFTKLASIMGLAGFGTVTAITPKPVIVTTPKPAIPTAPKPAIATTPKPVIPTAPKPAIATTPKPVIPTAPLRPVDDLIASAVVREIKGDYRGILDDMDRAIAINPEHNRLYYIRGTAKSELGDKKGAVADYDRDILINPKNSATYYNRGTAKYKLGNWQQALEDYNISIKIDPLRIATLYNRGNVKYQLRDKQGAIEDYTRAIAINPRFLEAYSNRGTAKYETGDFAGSIADNNLAIAMNHPKLGKMYSQKAFAQYEMGDRSNAVLSWRRALNLPYLPQDSQLALAIALYRLGKQDEALQLAQGAIRKDTKLLDIQHLRGQNWGKSILQDAVPLLQNLRR